MKLLAIRVTNFRSFSAEQVFSFPDKPGLYFMQGINRVEPRLGANGAGKSTIWDALTWCLFDKTPKGLRAGDVNNWESGKGTKVELDFALADQDNVLWTITRTWKPNSWRLSHIAEMITDEEVVDLTKDPSNPILADLRLGFEPFLNSILTAQGQPMFLDLKHDAQAALFSDVMGLDRWLGYSSTASKKASSQDSVNRVLERKLADLDGRLSQIGKKDLDLAVNEWEAKRRHDLDELETRYQKRLGDLDQLKTKTQDLTDAAEDARLLLAQVRSPNDELRDSLKQLDRELNDTRMLVSIDTKDLDRLTKVIEQLVSDPHCPTCGQSISKGSSAGKIREHTSQRAKLQSTIDQQLKSIKRWEEKVKQLERDLRENEDQELDAGIKHDQCTSAMTDHRRAIQQLDDLLDRDEEEAEALEAQVNPYEALQEQARYDLERIRSEKKATQRLLDSGYHRHSVLSYWVRGFKEVRLQLIAEALNELEIEVNSCVETLGLSGWELKFQVDRETKGGSIQRGFSVLVRSPHNQLMVPWEAWSGGEAQRLRLACTMGLADLIRSRTGADLALEVWDEPTRELSSQGVDDLLQALATRAVAEDRQIFIVDHRTHNFGGFSGIVTVTKDKQGSTIKWED